MKAKKSIWAVMALFLYSMSFVSCGNSDEPNGGEGGKDATNYAYILCEGIWGSNNATISYYPLNEGGFVSDIYYEINKAKLGDLANDMIEYDDCVYVLLNGSKYVARLDANAVEKARHILATEDEGTPRYMDADDGYLYVTQHGGKVSKLNAGTLKLESEFKGGDNLEGIVAEDGRLYVSNGFKVDGSGNFIYNKEVLVIDAATMKQVGTIAVVENPDRIYEINGKIYVISKGNYADVQPALQVIDTRNLTAKSITSAEKITEGNNGLIYGVRSAYDANWNLQNEFFTYNPKTGVVSEKTFLQDAPSDFSTIAIYMLVVDDDSGDIYVGTSDYVTTGTIYRFDKNGKLKTSFDAGGINPKAMIFMD